MDRGGPGGDGWRPAKADMESPGPASLLLPPALQSKNQLCKQISVIPAHATTFPAHSSFDNWQQRWSPDSCRSPCIRGQRTNLEMHTHIGDGRSSAGPSSGGTCQLERFRFELFGTLAVLRSFQQARTKVSKAIDRTAVFVQHFISPARPFGLRGFDYWQNVNYLTGKASYPSR